MEEKPAFRFDPQYTTFLIKDKGPHRYVAKFGDFVHVYVSKHVNWYRRKIISIIFGCKWIKLK